MRIVGNEFVDSEQVLLISGEKVPQEFRYNAVEGAVRLLENRSGTVVDAAFNWWGSDDEEWIAARLQGPIVWLPFLTADPRSPGEFALHQNYPNPFADSTTIVFSVEGNTGEGWVSVEVFSSTGQRVRRLVEQPDVPGVFSVIWDGRDFLGRKVASGVYYCRLRSGERRQTRAVLLLE